jgi:hypothetical protein
VPPQFLISVIHTGEESASRPGCFIPGEITHRNQLDMNVGGSQSRSARCEEKNLLPLPGIEPQPSIP